MFVCSLQVLNSLVSAIFPASITFTQKELLASGLVHGFSSPSKGCGIVPGFAQVSAYLNIFSALMDQHFSREKFEEKEKLQQQHQQQARGYCFCHSLQGIVGNLLQRF